MASSGTFLGNVFTGTWSTTLISVTGGTGTLDQLYAELNGDTEPITRTGTDPYTYTINGNRELRLSSSTLNIINDGDILQWDLSAAKYPTFNVSSTATLNVGNGTTSTDGITIKGDKNESNYSYWYFYGTVNIQGTESAPIILSFYRSMYLWFLSDTPYDWNWVDIVDNVYYRGYFMCFGRDQDSYCNLENSFRNINIYASSKSDYGVGLVFESGDHSNTLFENISMYDIRSIMNSSGVSFCIKNGLFYNIASDTTSYENGGEMCVSHFQTSKESRSKTEFNQGKVLFDNCKFYNNYTTSTGMVLYAFVGRRSVMYFKDCVFGDEVVATPLGVYARDGIAIYVNPTFQNITNNDRYWSGSGTHLWGRTLTLTVVNNNGDPIENAMVQILQSEGKERWSGFTNSDGELKDIYGYDYILIEKEETYLDNFIAWSDSMESGRFHTISINKDGYQSWSQRIEMTANRALTVALIPNNSIKRIGI